MHVLCELLMLVLILVQPAHGLNCCAQCKTSQIYVGGKIITINAFIGGYVSSGAVLRVCGYDVVCEAAGKPWACPVGKERPHTDCRGSCIACQVGFYSDGGPAGCLICPAGSACQNGIRTICPAETYQPSEGQTSCLPCPANTYQASSGQTSCQPCNLAPGYYGQTVGGVATCTRCVCTGRGQVYVSCPAGSQALGCPPCTGGDSDTGYTCPVGMQPSVVCDGTQTTNAVCVNCPAGKHKPSNLDRWCGACPDGQYKASASAANCVPCTNKRPMSTDVAVYGAWASTTARTSNTCPWSCAAGHYKPASGACVACNLTAGKYALAGKTGSCSACSNKPGNSSYVTPRGFDGRTDSCPWACNAGYERLSTGVCLQCEHGKQFRVAGTLVEGAAVVPCQACTVCEPGKTFETSPCLPWQDRVCSPCSGVCKDGQRVVRGCNATADTACEACATQCSAGQYRSTTATCLAGAGTVDVVLASCRACVTVDQCEAGKTFLSSNCTGRETTSNACAGCSSWLACPSGYYRGGCGGYSDTQCLPYPVCAAGQFLDGAGETTPGRCLACRNCAAAGLSQQQACTAQKDTVCGGQACSLSSACPGAGQYCDLIVVAPAGQCGACPTGYGSWMGLYCAECPEGKTCDRLGRVACDGQCGAGIRSECDAGLGYARCDAEQTCNLTTLGTGMAPQWRGTYQSPAPGDCATYVRCAAGWFRRFSPEGRVSCVQCSGGKPGLGKWVTPGLWANDAASCLWECDYGLQQAVVARDGSCVSGGMRSAVPVHAPGWYGAATCGAEMTSEANTTLDAGGCLACPARPENALAVPGGVECEWTCPTGWAARGARCVPVWQQGWACDDAGVSLDAAGACVPTAVPWNPAGTRKTALGAVTVDTSGPAQGTWVPVATPLSPGASLRSVVYQGVSYSQLAGQLCSMTVARLGGHDYLLGAVCGQAFLAYLNLSAGSSTGLGVLIGRAESPGWADGFRTQARFQTELHVAMGTDNATLWVLDRWNCLVREVTVWERPGDYRTRAYTVHGVTMQAGPKCYGPGSLAGPRRFFRDTGADYRDVLLFADDKGLWQLDAASGALARVIDEGALAGFEADDLAAAAVVAGRTTVLLGFSSGATWAVRASVEPCPNDRTSPAGGDCVARCEWPAYYVNGSSGECVACDLAPACKVGEEPVGCERGRQARCRACAPAAATVWSGDGVRRVYAKPGVCEADQMRYALPTCPAGYYAGPAYCEPCPTTASGVGTTTRLPGATRVEQCKCGGRLRRRAEDGACIGEALFVYPPEPGCGLCNSVPPNATLVDGHGYGRCLWECQPGFFRDVSGSGGWAERCRPCARVGYHDEVRVPATRGDDGAPLSCEFAWPV